MQLDTHCCCCQERHCGYLLSNRSQSHRMRQTIHVAPSICPLSASYFRGGYVPPLINSSYHPAPRLLGFHSSSSSDPSSSPNALRLRGIFFAFLRFFLPGPRYTVGVRARSDILCQWSRAYTDTNTISTTQLTATSKLGSPIDCCHSVNVECNRSRVGSIVSQLFGLRSLFCLFVMPLPKPLKPISCCTKDKAYGMSSNGISLNMEGMNSICLSVNIAITTL